MTGRGVKGRLELERRLGRCVGPVLLLWMNRSAVRRGAGEGEGGSARVYSVAGELGISRDI